MTTDKKQLPLLADRIDAGARQRMARITDRTAERAEVKRAADESAAAIAEQRRRVLRTEPIAPYPTSKDVEAYLATFATMLGRSIALTRVEHDRRLAVVQRCRACCAEIVTRIGDLSVSTVWQSQVAHAVRHSYETHRCAPIDVAMHGCTDAELDALIETAEAEGERCFVRVDALRTEYRRRAERITKP